MKTIEFILDHILIERFKKLLTEAGFAQTTEIKFIHTRETDKISVTSTCHEHELANLFLKFNSMIEASDGIWETYGIIKASN